MTMRATRDALAALAEPWRKRDGWERVVQANIAEREVEAMEDLWKAAHDFATDERASWGAVLRALQRLEDMETAA